MDFQTLDQTEVKSIQVFFLYLIYVISINYNKLYYNLARSAGGSNASGVSTALINIDEEYVGKHIDSDNQWRYDEVVNGLTNFVGQGVKIVL